jgi:hypothetical protein
MLIAIAEDNRNLRVSFKSREELARGLCQYASLLQWRAERREKSESPVEQSGVLITTKEKQSAISKGKEREVMPHAFYGPKSRSGTGHPRKN